MSYTKDGRVLDRREMLKVNLKSLAQESKIIRRMEWVRRERADYHVLVKARTKDQLDAARRFRARAFGEIEQEMHLHRTGPVRDSARHAHMAYGLIRGKMPDQIEATYNRAGPIDWSEVVRLINKYGPPGIRIKTIDPQEIVMALTAVRPRVPEQEVEVV